MADDTLKLTIQSDENGAMKLSCPFCNEVFKIYISDWKNFDGDKLCCALCGLSSESKNFLPKEVYEAAEQAAHAIAEKMIYDAFKGFQNNNYIKITMPKPQTPLPDAVRTDSSTDAVYTCTSCQKEYRIPNLSDKQKTYCPFCGELT